MTISLTEDEVIRQALRTAKTIAMVGVSSVKINESSTNIRRRPSIIVMKYLQEFGYKVIPVNPTSAGKEIYGEVAVPKLTDIKIPIDIVNVFRPSQETPSIAKQAVEISAKVLWLQYGIQNSDAKRIAETADITCVSNKCIKQEYQRLFLKMMPVFPALK